MWKQKNHNFQLPTFYLPVFLCLFVCLVTFFFLVQSFVVVVDDRFFSLRLFCFFSFTVFFPFTGDDSLVIETLSLPACAGLTVWSTDLKKMSFFMSIWSEYNLIRILCRRWYMDLSLTHPDRRHLSDDSDLIQTHFYNFHFFPTSSVSFVDENVCRSYLSGFGFFNINFITMRTLYSTLLLSRITWSSQHLTLSFRRTFLYVNKFWHLQLEV